MPEITDIFLFCEILFLGIAMGCLIMGLIINSLDKRL